jgi:hypothetical protein
LEVEKLEYTIPASRVLALVEVIATQVPEDPILLSQVKADIEELFDAFNSTERTGEEEQ